MCENLEDFGQAKTELLSIYKDMGSHLQQLVEQLQQSSCLEEELRERIGRQLSACIEKIASIGEMLQRKHMKVAFFGRTSNGKSAVINAMLHQRILPSAMGHTTSCFCQVEACARAEPAHVLIEAEGEHEEKEQEQQLAIDSLRHLASAHSAQALSAHRLLRVRWPSSSCRLLAHDVVLLDTPGVDVTAQLDECIDRHCLNADVFVLVLNAESTMARVERQFFESVAQQLSRPNLFILNNRWDVAASMEPQLEQLVRQQHTERCLRLLIEELGIYSSVELASRRIFHVSALETLRRRQGQQDDLLRLPGARQRYEEFLSFEREFSACITQSAMRTKFEQHCAGALDMLLQLDELLQQLIVGLTELAVAQAAAEAALAQRCECWEVQIMQQQCQLQLQVEQLSEETVQLGAQLLQEQITRLPAAVQQYEAPLHDEICEQYQRSLSLHLEHVLWEQLETQLAQRLQLPMNGLNGVPWQLYCCVDCHNLMRDFSVDLQFRFSWGMAAMLKRIQAKLQAPEMLGMPEMPLPPLEADSSSLGAMLLLSGLLARCLGWRLLLVASGALGSFYVYELCSWTREAQERSFKTQYTQHLQQRLREVVPQTAGALGQQVRQQLTHSMRQMSAETEQSRSELCAEQAALKLQVEQLQQAQARLRALQGAGETLQQRLESFRARYLKVNEKI